MQFLGIDLSTQSLSALVLEKNADKLQERGSWQVNYRELLEDFHLGAATMTLEPDSQLDELNRTGQYDQVPGLYLRSLDLLFTQMKTAGFDFSQITALNCSSQQHGQVYLNSNFDSSCKKLHYDEGIKSLESHFLSSYAYDRVPIWMTSNTGKQAEHLEKELSKTHILNLTGSNNPLRFSGLCLRWLAEIHPEKYEATKYFHLISSFLCAVLSARPRAQIDWGNACGTSMFDYNAKTWSPELLARLAKGLPGGIVALQDKLLGIACPHDIAGNIASYFVDKYGFPARAKVLFGSGDNPQTKVSVDGDLLSLGSSFVLMADSKKTHHPWANAMYDGLGRRFSFVCRTNGALVWDVLRERLHMSFAEQEQLLETQALGSCGFRVWNQLAESFPPGPSNNMDQHCKAPKDFVAFIDGALRVMAQSSLEVFGASKKTLYLTGGAAQSPAIAKRVAELWNRPVELAARVGAAYGAAYGAAQLIKMP